MVKVSISAAELAHGVLEGDRAALGRAITLIESSALQHADPARELLRTLLPKSGSSIRVGITGIPGAGKSTLIESLGCSLCDSGHRVAVLAVDPSSAVSGGSILGDKTRMDALSQHSQSFVRPSPSGGTPGGVNRKTREAVILCEAAGYDVIFVETVGVGQNEAAVRSMVDFFLLLTITGAGDELQGFKRGVMELADAIAVNKADGDNIVPAERTCTELNTVLHYLMPPTPAWETRAIPVSALSGEGIADIWSIIEEFKAATAASGAFEQRRKSQLAEWMDALVVEQLQHEFYNNPKVKAERTRLRAQVSGGRLPATTAAAELFELYLQNRNSDSR